MSILKVLTLLAMKVYICYQITLFECLLPLLFLRHSVSDPLALQDPFLLLPTPDRDLRQPRSSGGKLAYTIFGDPTDGVFYNW
jgi:hypothetical protein